jgi:predicted membrane chloride channel (bestrophin family)
MAQLSKQEELRNRTKQFALRVINLFRKEADESVFWLERLIEMGIVKEYLLRNLLAEANELVAIFAASQRTARGYVPITR